MKDNFTPELIEKAKQANTPEELLSLAKENGIELSEDKAKEYFERLGKSGEMSDEELGSVAGGGCYYDDGRLVVTACYKCRRFVCKNCGAGNTDGKNEHWCINDMLTSDRCPGCKYKTASGLRMLCNHPLNYKR